MVDEPEHRRETPKWRTLSLLAAFALLVPQMWDRSAASQRIPPPLDWKLTIGGSTGTVLSANDIIAMIVAPAAMIGVVVFLGSTRLGTAIRGSAERSERALMLGIPVAWLSTPSTARDARRMTSCRSPPAWRSAFR